MQDKSDIEKAIMKATAERDGRMILHCAKAFQIAEDMSVSLGEVGQICNDLKVKIAHCQLGCFK